MARSSGDFFGNEITLADFRINDVRTSQLTLNSEGYHGGGDDGLMATLLDGCRTVCAAELYRNH